MIPSARLWLALCLLAVPTTLVGFVPQAWPAVLLIDVVLLALGVTDFLVARSSSVLVRRVLPPRLQVGVDNVVQLQLHNKDGRSVTMAIRDDAPPEFETAPAQVDLALGSRERTTVTYTARPKTRGRFGFGDVHVRVLGPLGLMWHERTLPSSVVVSVFPDMRGASRLLLGDAMLDLVNLGLRQLKRDGRGSEFARLRDYTQGDSVREVDWKATGRRGKPVTRVMESERSQTVLIAIDAGRAMAARVDELTKLDHAVNAALFLAFVAVRNGDRVGLVVFADDVKAFLPPASGRAQYRKIVDTLYDTKPNLTYVDYLELFRELNVRLRKRSLLCVFTDLLDEDQAQTMVNPLKRLARRHVPLCLTVKDSALGQLLRTPPAEVELAYQHAVGAELLIEREGMKRKVAQDGVRVIDVDAQDLNFAAVNAYLEIKARGAL